MGMYERQRVIHRCCSAECGAGQLGLAVYLHTYQAQGNVQLSMGSGDALSIMFSPHIGGSVQVSGERDFFATMVVDAVSALDVETLDMSLLGVKKVWCRIRSLRQPLPCRA